MNYKVVALHIIRTRGEGHGGGRLCHMILINKDYHATLAYEYKWRPNTAIETLSCLRRIEQN
jgi:hypothetical protein